MTTPTPGDLSARLLADELDQCAKACEVYSPDQCATLIDGIGWIAMRHKLQRAAETIRALSALPAAGGAKPRPVAWYVFAGTEHWVTHDEDEAEGNRAGGCEVRPLIFGDTTPQPSAAKGECSGYCCPGCGRCYQCHKQALECATTTPDAAVGAQGDEVVIGATRCYGEDNWFRELTARGVTFLVPLDQQDKARHALAAPAAGKGVDASAANLMQEASEVLQAVGVSGVSLPDNWRWPLADELTGRAALTRQPVAGDGWRSVVYAALRSIRYNANNGSQDRPPHERLRLIGVEADRAIGCMEASYAAPAATPTDGGEG